MLPSLFVAVRATLVAADTYSAELNLDVKIACAIGVVGQSTEAETGWWR